MRESLRRPLTRIAHVLLWAVAGYYFAFGGEYTVFDRRELELRRDGLEERLDSLRTVADSLERRAALLRSDSAVIERTAREEYGFLRDGEHLYRFVEVDPGEQGG